MCTCKMLRLPQRKCFYPWQVLGTQWLRQRANELAYVDPTLASRDAMLVGRLNTHMPGESRHTGSPPDADPVLSPSKQVRTQHLLAERSPSGCVARMRPVWMPTSY